MPFLAGWSVHDLPGGICVNRRDDHTFLIPKRLFGTSEEAADVIRRARAWHDASGYGEARRLRTLLADRDVPCPKCGFNLRGITCGACPECGLSLSTQMWPQAPSRAE